MRVSSSFFIFEFSNDFMGDHKQAGQFQWSEENNPIVPQIVNKSDRGNVHKVTPD